MSSYSFISRRLVQIIPVLIGDLGQSLRFRVPVLDLVLQ